MPTRGKPYPREIRERAVRLVLEHQQDYDSQWEAICSVAEKLGPTAETVRKWVRRAEIDGGVRPGVSSAEGERIRQLERENREPPTIFTPDNEPYLGRPSLLLFDQVLLTLVAEQHRIGPWTRTHDLTPVQRAASEIVPSACSLAFSVRELVRQGYLLAARIQLRPLIERVSTLTYLIDHDEAVTSWQTGWPHASRPSLHARLQTIGSRNDTPPTNVTAAFKDLLHDFNSMIHGDPRSALSSAVLLPDGGPGYTVTKDVTSPARADEICGYACAFAMVLTVRCHEVFPPEALTRSPA